MEEETKDKCVYFHINPLKNEIFYVGMGDIRRPYVKSHRSRFWKGEVNKYGYIIDICETELTFEQACEREKYYIKKIGRRDKKLGTLVNHTDGGDGQRNPSEFVRMKMSIAKKGKKQSEEHKKNIGLASIGRVVSKETREKISKGHIGKILSDITKNKISEFQKSMSKEDKLKISIKKSKPIFQYTLQGEFIKEWYGAIYIERELGFGNPNITSCCKGKRKKAYGFVWKYKNINNI